MTTIFDMMLILFIYSL